MITISLRQKITLVLFGIVLSLFLIEIGLRMGGRVYIFFQEARNKKTLGNGAGFHILCLGESTTAMGQENSWPAQLERILNSRYKNIKFSVINKGMPGAYTSTIIGSLDDYFIRYRPNMVITMMGINDAGVAMPYGKQAYQNVLSYFSSLHVYKLYKLLMERMNRIRDPKFGRELDRAYFRSQEIAVPNFKDKKDNFLKDLNQSLKDERVWKYIAFAWECRDNKEYEEAETMFKKAAEEDSENFWVYHDLGMCYEAQGKYAEAEAMFKKSIEKNPVNDWGYIELGWIYHSQGKDELAQEMFDMAIKVNPRGDKAYGGLALFYSRDPLSEQAKRYSALLKRIRLNSLNPVTRRNYQILKEKTDSVGIKLVCAQYPVRSVVSLKKMLAPSGGIIFVDNEKIFKDALKQGDYFKYFEDSFAGDFGHCTKRGNELLAKNIADTLSYYFK